jgi:hypothetical protein
MERDQILGYVQDGLNTVSYGIGQFGNAGTASDVSTSGRNWNDIVVTFDGQDTAKSIMPSLGSILIVAAVVFAGILLIKRT